MKEKKRFILISIIVLFSSLLLGFMYLKTQYLFVIKDFNVKEKIGIIDDNLSSKHANVIQSNILAYSNSKESHGDLMLNFLEECKVNNIYYYDAYTENGKISTDSIILGLEWMKANNVKFVNISLSSKNKSEELENWIKENKNTITIYSSYSNITQSFDYPAMYDDVIGSGTNEDLMNLEKDRHYKSNNVVLGFNIKKCYQGNSYLSIISLLLDLNKK